MTSNKLSIVTVSFQAAPTIKSALESVSRQNIAGLEHLVQDGGSTDETAKIVDAYPHARFISEPDGGIYDGLNKAIKNISGDVIGLLHADDFYPHDNVLARVMETFDKNPDILGVYGDLQYVRASKTDQVVRHWAAGSFSRKKLRRGWMSPHPTLFLRREVYETVGDFDTRFMISADYDFIIRVFSHCGDKIAYLPDVLTNMRLGGISNSGLRNLIRKFREDLIIARRAGFFAPFTVICKMVSKLVQIRLPL
jgi:glycosyltransferase